MPNEVVKYHNDLNTVPMRNWTKEEMNFFFSIIAKVRDRGTKELNFDKYELADLANYSVTHNKRFRDTIENLGKKIQEIYYIERTSNSFEIMNLFQTFKVHWSDDLTEMNATIKISEDFEYVVNKLDVEFTTYELEEFTQIKSTYAKTMYRLLKQWRIVGKREYGIDDLRKLLDIPKSYGIGDIDRRVIAPIKRELPNYFGNLKVKKVKANTRGTPVTGYIFTWKPEKTSGKFDPNKYESKKLGKKVTRKETMPDWYYEDSSEEDTVDPEVEKEFNEKLRKMREDKK